MSPGGVFTGASTDAGLERVLLVLEGTVRISCVEAEGTLLGVDQCAFSPAGHVFGLTAPTGALLLVFERRYRPPGAAEANGKVPAFFHSPVRDCETVVPAGEVYRLRRLLPLSREFDFNVHVMDFAPGEYLHAKEAHHNQHGMLMLEGQGVMRFGDKWYPVHAGDAFWAAPFVSQWFGALGTRRTRFVAFRDTNRDPAVGGKAPGAPSPSEAGECAPPGPARQVLLYRPRRITNARAQTLRASLPPLRQTVAGRPPAPVKTPLITISQIRRWCRG